MAESWGGAWDKAGLDVLVSFPDPTTPAWIAFSQTLPTPAQIAFSIARY